MLGPQLDVESALPAWNHLNNVSLFDIAPREIPGRGVGLVACRDLSRDEDSSEVVTLAKIPRGLILSGEAVEAHAKVDGHFRELLDAVGRKSTRGDVCLFLLTQSVLAAAPAFGGVATPFTEYVKFLPKDIPLPSLWSEQERRLLSGTSLEEAVRAKLLALTYEYDLFREKTAELPFWNQLLWDNGPQVTIADWFLVDAWYRSRTLELPRIGEAMIPVLDLTNHSSGANAYYEESGVSSSGRAGEDVVELLLRPGSKVSAGEEVTISYGDAKSAAEMLFSYGFIEPAAVSAAATQNTATTVTLPLAPLEDDPLGRAKQHAFGAPAVVELTRVNGRVVWKSPFAWLACLNEEDGLAFRVLQDNGGNRELRVFWEEEDLTDELETLEERVASHALSEIFRLRVVAVVEDRVSAQLERLRTGTAALPREQDLGNGGLVRAGCIDSARMLRDQEADVLEGALERLADQKSQLLADESVVAYLGSREISPKEQADDGVSNESDDFS